MGAVRILRTPLVSIAAIFARVDPIDTREEKIIRQSVGNAGKISWENGRPAGRHQPLKFLSSPPRVPDDGRDRALDGGRQEVQPLRPSGRDYDPDRLSPRLAGVRVVRSAMVAG